MAARIVSDIVSKNKEKEKNKPSTETWEDVIQEIKMPQTGRTRGGGESRRTKEVVIHDMDEFHRRLISSVRVTEESALKGSFIEKKRKRKVAASIREVNQIDYEKAKTMAARIVSNILSNNKEKERNKPSTET